VVPVTGRFVDGDRGGLIHEYFPNGTLDSAPKAAREGNAPAGFGGTAISKRIFGVAFPQGNPLQAEYRRDFSGLVIQAGD
jgi:hypothetical protein